MGDICGDNRFEIIEKAKKNLLESTNIHTSEDEMKALDSFLFRCWQMGWLERYDKPREPLDIPTMTTDFVKEHGLPCPDGYIFKDENGNVINATKIVLEKKRKEYPKTFEECCKILGLLNVDLCFNADYRSFDASKEQWKRLGLMNQFYQLLICRDAYWKIAGEEMGLGEPWEPDWLDDDTKKYVITSSKVFETFCGLGYINYILTFQTAEMRDAFKENFDPDIEKCKEFL